MVVLAGAQGAPGIPSGTARAQAAPPEIVSAPDLGGVRFRGQNAGLRLVWRTGTHRRSGPLRCARHGL